MRLLTYLSLSLNAVFFIVACGSSAKMPRWDGKTFAGDHKRQAVVRLQDDPQTIIPTSDPRFSRGAWISYHDLGCLYQQLVLNCKEWRDLEPKCTPIDDKVVVQAIKSIRR